MTKSNVTWKTFGKMVSPWAWQVIQSHPCSVTNLHARGTQAPGRCNGPGRCMSSLRELHRSLGKPLVFLGKLYSISPVAALGVHLGFRALLRTGELLSLESKDIVIGPKALNAVLHLGLTKTGVQNPSAGSITLTDMELIQRLALWKASLKHSTPLIPWSPAKFRSIFHQCCADCQLSSYQYKPYSLRRGATDLWISSQNLVWWPMQDGGLVKRPFEYMFKTALLCFRFFTSVHLFLNASGKTTIFLWVVLSLRCRQEGGVVEWDDLNLFSLQPLFTSSLFPFVSVNAKACALPTNWLTWKRLTWGCSRFVLFSTNLSCIAKRGMDTSLCLVVHV